MKYSLHKIYPKEKTLGVGDLYVGEKKDANFYDDASKMNARILATMERTALEWIGADAMKLTGFEHVGYDKQNCKKFIYQEWYLRKAE
jgi:hypothetical protein